jgi:hypothetical protein
VHRMNLKALLQGVKRDLYFAAVPWCNYPINLFWHHRLSGQYIPKVLYIEGTNCCNARCIMCPHEKMTRPRGHMEWDLFRGIVDQCAQFEGRGLRLFLHKDGEPLMDPLLFDRIEYAGKALRRSTLHFNTNAALLDEEKCERILGSGLNSITFSVDGGSAETYERIRAGLKYEAVRSNIERYFRLRGGPRRGPRVILQMVMNRDNRHEVDAFRRQWEDRADAVFIKPMHNFLVQGTALCGGDVGQVQVARCTMPSHVMLFYQNGDVGLCCWDFDHIRKLGNARDGSLLELFNSDAYAEVRRAMQRKDCAGISPCCSCSQIYGHDGPMWAPRGRR